MTKGGRMKVVWPRGKNLKPLPAGKDLQAIPEVMKRTGVLQLPSTPDLLADHSAYKLAQTTAPDPRMAPAPVTAARLREMLASMPPAQTEALKILEEMKQHVASMTGVPAHLLGKQR
ncbi:hypothetical protein HF272_13680 [Rhizobium leguminosarum]|uniref:hypothetical protein n=1 Tax=Rhizobium leguminosarum TaxID=384 RepID=UPI001C90A7BC|nr:hypothetical protein [Rhizobium leguminosarum]MBY2992480.1 hypothetical protein [Rhizobium leguminosarum]